jgi:hypothetical protein
LPPAGAGVLFAPWPYAPAAAATGGTVSILLGGSVALAGSRPPADPLPTGLAVGCTVAGTALLAWVFHRVMLTTRWRASLLAPLALLPAVQFWHATSFVPARLTTSMSIDPRVAVQREDTETLRGAVEVQLRNTAMSARSYWPPKSSSASDHRPPGDKTSVTTKRSSMPTERVRPLPSPSPTLLGRTEGPLPP